MSSDKPFAKKAEQCFKKILSVRSLYNADVIYRMVNTGDVEWKDLSFGEKELEQKVLSIYLAEAEKCFEKLKTGVTIFPATEIQKLIGKGAISWAMLSFSQEELAHEQQSVHVRRAERFFAKLQQRKSVQEHINLLRGMIKEQVITWPMLSFTEKDFLKEERAAHLELIVPVYNDAKSNGYETLKHYTTMLKVRNLVDGGVLNWGDLPFSKKDFEAVFQAKTNKKPSRVGSSLVTQITRAEPFRAKELEKRICGMVNEGKFGWEDIDTTKEALSKEVLKRAVHYATRHFESLKRTQSPERHLLAIRSLFDHDLVTWGDLPFTEKDLYKQERCAYTRIAEDHFSAMKSGVTSSPEKILNLVRQGKVRWSWLTFSEEDMASV